MVRITPSALWLIHHQAAGGHSTISGAPLPETLDQCSVGPQETHYAMACAIATAYGEVDAVPVPPLVTADRAQQLRDAAQKQGRTAAGLAGIFSGLAPAH